jgi:ribosomal protein S18 acetylase RimI-like enzyme
MSTELQVHNGERAHVGQWRELDGVGVIAPPPGEASPGVATIGHFCDVLGTEGYRSVVTPALTSTELVPFLQAGFVTREQLHVLVHDLRTITDAPPPRDMTLRRARNSDVAPSLAVDRTAFDAFWRFDRASLLEACAATPQARYRVAVTNHTSDGVDAGTVVGYCITGRSRSQGFLQRLAVDPRFAGRGIGSALVLDCLQWLHRRRSRSCIVNTQEANTRAVALYRRHGFTMAQSGLFVLTRPLHPSTPGETE